MGNRKPVSITSIVIWISLFFISIVFSELEIPYEGILLILFVGLISRGFKEYKVSFIGVAIFAVVLIVTLPLTISNKELDTISISASNIDKHGNNIYIKTKEILDNGEITLEDIEYLDSEKDEMSKWCEVFDRQSDIIGVPKKRVAQGKHVGNVFLNQDEDDYNYNISQRVVKFNKIELTDDERTWVEGIKNRSYEILMTKIIQEGDRGNYMFAKMKVRKLYYELYKTIHAGE